jgi:hypothetical protein
MRAQTSSMTATSRARRRRAGRGAGTGGAPHDEFEGPADGVDEQRRVPGQVGGGEGVPDDLEAGARGGVQDLQRGAGREGVGLGDESAGGVDGVPGDVLEAAVVEGGLHGAAVPPPDLAVTGEQPRAGDGRERRVLDRRLAVATGVLHQDVADPRGIGEHEDGGAGHRDRGERSVPATDVGEEDVRGTHDAGDGPDHLPGQRPGDVEG